MFELCKHNILFFNIDADKFASLYMLFLTLYAYAQLVNHLQYIVSHPTPAQIPGCHVCNHV